LAAGTSAQKMAPAPGAMGGGAGADGVALGEGHWENLAIDNAFRTCRLAAPGPVSDPCQVCRWGCRHRRHYPSRCYLCGGRDQHRLHPSELWRYDELGRLSWRPLIPLSGTAT